MGAVPGPEVAAVDFAAAADAVQGVLPCSDGERQVLLVAASIAEGIPVDLREAALVHGRGERRAGCPGGVSCGRPPCAGGGGGWPVTAGAGHGEADPAAASVGGPAAAGAGQHAPARGLGAAGGAAGRLQAADPGGVDRWSGAGADGR